MRLASRWLRRIFSWRGLLVAVLLIGGAAWYAWPDDQATRDWAKHYDVHSREPNLMKPGTIVGTTPPEGWSRIVIKSHPRLAPEERDKVNGFTARKTEFLFTAFVADVQPEAGTKPPRYRLRALAIGMGTQVRGEDMILSPETTDELNADLSLLDKQILSTGYQRQAQARQLIDAPTFALLDCPVPYRCGNRNWMVAYRYALLVDEKTGKLDVLHWWVDHAHNCERPGPLELLLLPENLCNEPLLYVDDSQFKLGVPTDTAFAVVNPPPAAARFAPPPELIPFVEKPNFNADDARSLENGLRKLLKNPLAP